MNSQRDQSGFLDSEEKNDRKQIHYHRPLQNAAPIYLHARALPQSTSFQPITSSSTKEQVSTDNDGSKDPPSAIQLVDDHDCSSVSDSCVTGSKSLERSESGSPNNSSIPKYSITKNDVDTNNPKQSILEHFHDEENPTVQKKNEKMQAQITRRTTLTPALSDVEQDSFNSYDGDKSSSSSIDSAAACSRSGRSAFGDKINSNNPKSNRIYETNENDGLVTQTPPLLPSSRQNYDTTPKENYFISDSSDENDDDNKLNENKRDKSAKEEVTLLSIEDTPFDEANEQHSKISQKLQQTDSYSDHSGSMLDMKAPQISSSENSSKESIESKAFIQNSQPDFQCSIDEKEVGEDDDALEYATLEETMKSRSELIASLKSRLASYLDEPEYIHENIIENDKQVQQHIETSCFDQSNDNDTTSLSPAPSLSRKSATPVPSSFSDVESLSIPSQESSRSSSQKGNVQQSPPKIITNSIHPSTYQSFAALSNDSHSSNRKTLTDVSHEDKLIHTYESLIKTNDQKLSHLESGANKFFHEDQSFDRSSLRPDENGRSQGKNELRQSNDCISSNSKKDAIRPRIKEWNKKETFSASQRTDVSVGHDERSNLESSRKLEESQGIESDIVLQIAEKHSIDASRYDDTFVYGGITENDSDLDPLAYEPSTSSHQNRSAEFETRSPTKLIGQSLSSHLVLKPKTTTIDYSVEDEDSIFVFSEDVEAQARKQNIVNKDIDRTTPPRKDKVVFDDEKNTIHRFDSHHVDDNFSESFYSETDEDETTYDSDYSKDTYDTRASFNTLYSKSMQSEVEDAMKDLFFIGRGTHNAPGRRKMKYRSDVKVWKEEKRKNKKEIQKASSTREMAQVDDNHSSKNSTRADESTIETQFDWMWGYVENGINAVGEVFGLANTSQATSQTEDMVCEYTSNSDSVVQNIEKSQKEILKLNVTDKEERPQHTSSSKPKHEIQSPSDPQSQSQTQSIINNYEGSNVTTLTTTLYPNSSNIDVFDGFEELAICAAQTFHQNKGLAFDESVKLDMGSDVTLSDITISLPLGLLFQENRSGCWVTRIFSSGNAAKRPKGAKVEVGDQLAFVNGKSAYKLKIDETCAMISSSPNPEAIHLTFVRYIGPIRTRTNRKMKKKNRKTNQNFSHRTLTSSKNDSKVNLSKSKMPPAPPPPPPRKEQSKDLDTQKQPKIPYVDVVIKEEDMKVPPNRSEGTEINSILHDHAHVNVYEKPKVEGVILKNINDENMKTKDERKKKKILNLFSRFKKKK